MRRAAREGVRLETILRRSFAAYAALTESIVDDAGGSEPLCGAAFQRLLGDHAVRFDGLVDAIAEEHARELAKCRLPAGQRQAERVRRLLTGESLDGSNLDYELDGHHLGIVATGDDPVTALRDLARHAGRSSLIVDGDGDTVWAWLGGGAPVDAEWSARPTRTLPGLHRLALGEPSEGFEGWQLTHRQALAAWPIASDSENPVRYREVALLSAVLRDDLLERSLQEEYLEPLQCERNSGERLRTTLLAYFRADRNVSATATALGVSRQAVSRRLRAAERLLGRPLSVCGSELEVALRYQRIRLSLG